MIKNTVIGGLHVILDTDMEGHGEDHYDRVTGCWIEDRKTGCSASLDCLEATGCLELNGVEQKVDNSVINEIAEWADDEGY